MNNELIASQKSMQQHLNHMFKQHKKMITQGLTFEQVLKPFLKHKNKKYRYQNETLFIK